VQALIANQIARGNRFDQADELERWREARPPPQPLLGRRPFVPLALLSAQLLAFAFFCLTLAGPALVLIDTYLLPATEDRVAASMIQALGRPEFAFAENSGVSIAEVWRKHAAIDRRPTGHQMLLAPSLNPVSSSSIVRYYAYLLGTQFPAPGESDRTTFDKFKLFFIASEELVETARVHFLFGRLDRGAVPDPALAAEAWKAAIGREAWQSERSPFSGTMSVLGVREPAPRSITEAFVAWSSGRSRAEIDGAIDQLVEKKRYAICSRSSDATKRKHDFVVRAARFGSLDGVRAILAQCKGERDGPAMPMDAARAADAAGHPEVAAAIVAENFGDFNFNVPINPNAGAWRSLRLLIGANRADLLRPAAEKLARQTASNPAPAIVREASALIAQLKGSNHADIAEAMTSSILRASEERLLESRLLIDIDLAREVARLLEVTGRMSQLKPLADRLLSGLHGGPLEDASLPLKDVLLSNYGAYAAFASLADIAGMKAEARSAAAHALSKAEAQMKRPSDLGPSRADKLFDLALRLGLPSPRLDSALIVAIRNEGTSQRRADRYARMARVFAEHEYFFEARQMADAAAETSVTLACYALIMDRLLKKRDQDSWKKTQVKRDAFVDRLPECGEDG